MATSYTLGIDYGTNSVRALVVDVNTGAELGACVVGYPSGQEGVLLDARDHHLARQHPGDYLFGLEKSVRGALAQAKKTRGFDAKRVIGLGVDTTGSSPLPVDKNNVPLALLPKWKKNLAAQCWLWKDHTSAPRSGRDHARRGAAPAAVHREVRQHLFLRVVLGEDLALPESRAPMFSRRRIVGLSSLTSSPRCWRA